MLRKSFILFFFYIVSLPAYPFNADFPNIKDWKLNLVREVYDSNDLWTILGKKAEYFIGCGFNELRLAEYTKKDGKTIAVALFSFEDISGACGVYMHERDPDAEIQNIGTQGTYIRGELNFLAGKYFAKLKDNGKIASEKEELSEIAIQIINHLSPECRWPDPVTLLPLINRISNTEEYAPVNFLGYNFLNRVFSAKYYMNNPVTLFLLSRDTHEEAQVLLDRYLGIFREDKVTKTEDFYQVTDLFNGTVLMLVKSDFLIGVICYSNIDKGRKLLIDVAQKTM
jgi:hypothetical protein